MTEVEAEWSDVDRAQMQALAQIEADECPGCHGALSETTAPEAEGSDVVSALRCHRCTAIAEKAASIKDNPHPHAVLFHAEDRSV